MIKVCITDSPSFFCEASSISFLSRIMLQETDQLESSKQDLLDEIDQLEEQKSQLLAVLTEHDHSGQCHRHAQAEELHIDP